MNGSTNLKKKKYQLAALTILSVTLAAVSGCRTAQPILQSVIVKDTVIVTETKYLLDTLEVLKDTTIYQDKVRLQLKYIDRKVVVEAACLPDTVRVTQTKILAKQEPKKWNFDKAVFTIIFVLVFAYFIKRWIDKLTE
jgi:hypothetical protein